MAPHPIEPFHSTPYLVTRTSPGRYALVLLPEGLGEGELSDYARKAFSGRRCETWLVMSAARCQFLLPDGRCEDYLAPPRGLPIEEGVLATGLRFRPDEIPARLNALSQYLEQSMAARERLRGAARDFGGGVAASCIA